MSRRGVLLVGGAGFIGTALAHRLTAQGHAVHVLAPHTEPGSRNGIEYHAGKQSDTPIVRELLRLCDTVVHLASATTPGISAQAPNLDLACNLAPMSLFMEALSAAPPHRLVFISSGGAIYGNPDRLPANESQPVRPLSYHAAGKAAAEIFWGVFARHTRELSLAILRPSNVYGPGQALKSGFGIVRTLLEKAQTGETFEVWGATSQIRDFLYIDDLIDACLCLIDRPECAGTFNAGSGHGVSLQEIIDKVGQISGRQISTLTRPGRGVDVEAIYLDCRRLHDATGWRPTTSLDEGLKRTWNWLCRRNDSDDRE